MLVYSFIAIWPLLIGHVYKNRAKSIGHTPSNRNTYIIWAMLPVFLLLGLRASDVGPDTGTYIRNFLYVSSTPLDVVLKETRMEIGYMLFVKCISIITSSPLLYQLICAAVCAFGIFSFMRQLNDHWADFLFFVVTLGIYTFMFSGTRQSLAMCICLYSYQYVRLRKLIPFLCCVALAYSFHHSAALFGVVYFIAQRSIKWYNLMAYGIVTYAVTVFLAEVQNWFNEQLDYKYGVEETGSGHIFLALVTMLVSFCLVVLWRCRRINHVTRPLLNLSFITLFFWIIRLQTRVAERPSYYFMFFVCACLPYAFCCLKEGPERHLVQALVMGACFVLYIYRFGNQLSSYIPYHIYGG